MLRRRLEAGVKVVINRSGGGVIWELRKRRMSSDESTATQGGAPFPTGRSADPAIHSSELLGEDADAAANAASASKSPPKIQAKPHLVPPKPPHPSSPKLEHTEVGRPTKPKANQKRFSTNESAQPPPTNDINCGGLDVSPWPDDAEGQKAQKKAQEADNKDYFKEHKASPLSEIEFTDSRKPVSQATSHEMGGPNGGSYNVGGLEGLVWRPEQVEPAEVTMLKANEIWQWNKMRGDPESPHGKVLRALRQEYW